ncbi:hypothetical protein GCM10019059_44590 [Camelimonas fluminis]|uniref:Uncharacterized protein n=1 Tax=Camelimonas fluminis TaxID=1576911 RepID=A0ABV7UCB5_9HYPH|nr:hypothetical protein [Camelimonas fluminis]GHE81867.1 hypothetical protein GCM10019059_44590 [Camelimonas fluminis]
MPDSTYEVITGVAILDTQGRLWSLPKPHRHANIHALASFLNTSAEPGSDFREGFTTSHGRYLTREDALSLVRRTGQHLRNKKAAHRLYSEDLW